MQFILNNRTAPFEGENLTVNEHVKQKNYTFKLLVTKVNDKLIKINEQDQVLVRDGDRVEVLHLISGG
jgi:thiamine biosynthesis protein ThiS